MKLKHIPIPSKTLLSLGVLTSSLALMGQNNAERSPYSRFGYGNLNRATTAGLRGMGGVGYAIRDAALVNPSNPASYTAVDSLTFIFDVGLSAGISLLSESKVSDKRYMGNLDYITMLFPVGRRFAISAGMMPFAKVGYEFGDTQALGGDPNSQNSQRSYSGEGGYNQIYLGLGVNPYQGLHIGANIAYILGDRSLHSRYTIASATATTTTKSDNLRLSAFKFDLGVQYTQRLNEQGSKSLTIGASVTPPISFKSEQAIIKRSIATGGTTILQNDTIRSADYTIPLSLGIGVSYRQKNKLLLSGDVQYIGWEQAKFRNLEAKFQNQWRLALGAEYIPNYQLRSLWKRAKYRIGLNAGNSYLQVPTPIGSYAGYYELGISAGIGLPLVDRRSSLNLSIEYKHLQPKVSGLIREQYIGATIGIVFNEGWFRKARIN